MPKLGKKVSEMTIEDIEEDIKRMKIQKAKMEKIMGKNVK